MDTGTSNFSHMDYLTKSYSFAKHPGLILPTGLKPFYVEGDITPMPHYNRAWRLACGGTINLSKDTKQGARLDLSGQALEYIREYSGYTDDDLLLMLAKNDLHKRTTRIDYCFNRTGDANVQDLWKYCESGAYKGRMKVAPSVATPGKSEGQTVYFGSKDSEFRVRVYDKGAQMKMLSIAWARVEAQFRGKYAVNAAADACKGVGIERHTRTKIKQSLREIEIEWFKQALDGETAEVTGLHRKDTKFMNRMAQLMEEITKKALESEEQLDYIENEWLTQLAENILKARARANNAPIGDLDTVPLPTETYTINDDWTITRQD